MHRPISSIHLPNCIALTIAVAGLTLAAPQQGMAQELCSTHTVVRGDRLSLLATAAGVPGGFQALFDANRDVLASPSDLEVGQVLIIPCADGSLPTVVSPAIPASREPAPPAENQTRTLRIVTGSGYAPFADEDLSGGGMITRMVARALELGNPDQAYDLVFVNDWGAHLETLLPIGAFDMAFPWFKPNCDLIDNLSESSASRCTDFNHSDPFYETLVDFFTLDDSAYAAAETHEDLFGARICRPAARFTFDLEAERLVAPNIIYVTPASMRDCVRLLVSGGVDVITHDTLSAEEVIREAGFEDQVTKIAPLSSAVSVHVFVAKDNPIANEALPIINEGLEQLRLSGEWFSIVRESIQETVEN